MRRTESASGDACDLLEIRSILARTDTICRKSFVLISCNEVHARRNRGSPTQSGGFKRAEIVAFAPALAVGVRMSIQRIESDPQPELVRPRRERSKARVFLRRPITGLPLATRFN